MAVKRVFNARQAFFDSNGDPLNGGQLFVYAAGSSTKVNTYNSSSGLNANSDPLILDPSGRLQAEVWVTSGVSIKLVLTTSGDTDPPASPIWSEDNITGINDTTVTLDQWVSGPTPTYVSATSFTLVGDQTSTFHVGRRLKTTNSGGTIYSVISVSAYAALTTITVVNDSGTLDSGLSAVSYGLESSTNPSFPILTDTLFLVSGSADKTKKVRLEVDGLTTATTRTLTIQDASDTLVGLATTDVLTNKTLTSPVLNTAVTGTALATQAQQETGTATNVLVAPGTQKFHPSAAKAWAYTTMAGVATVSHNVSSVDDIGTGQVGINFTTAFSSASYCAVPGIKAAAPLSPMVNNAGTNDANGADFVIYNTGAAATDPNNFYAVFYGDQ